MTRSQAWNWIVTVLLVLAVNGAIDRVQRLEARLAQVETASADWGRDSMTVEAVQVPQPETPKQVAFSTDYWPVTNQSTLTPAITCTVYHGDGKCDWNR